MATYPVCSVCCVWICAEAGHEQLTCPAISANYILSGAADNNYVAE